MTATLIAPGLVHVETFNKPKLFTDHFLEDTWVQTPTGQVLFDGDVAVLVVKAGETNQHLSKAVSFDSTTQMYIVARVMQISSGAEWRLYVQRLDTGAWVLVTSGTTVGEKVGDVTAAYSGAIMGVDLVVNGVAGNLCVFDYCVVCPLFYGALYPETAVVTRPVLNRGWAGAKLTLPTITGAYTIDENDAVIIWAERAAAVTLDSAHKIFGGKVTAPTKHGVKWKNITFYDLDCHGYASEFNASTSLLNKVYDGVNGRVIVEDGVDCCRYIQPHPTAAKWFDNAGAYGSQDDRVDSVHTAAYELVKPLSPVQEILDKAKFKGSAVLYLPFDTGSGSVAYDSSGYGNDGAVTGATWVDGKVGKALNFNGSTDYVTIADNSVLNFTSASNFSCTAWVYPRSRTLSYFVIEKGIYFLKGYWFYLESSSGRVILLLNKSGSRIYGRSTNAVALNQWSHIAATVDRTTETIRIYINGVLEVESSPAPNPTGYPDTPSEIPLFIGKINTNTDFADGVIDEVRIYNRVLPANEILSLYNSPTAPTNVGFDIYETPAGVLVGHARKSADFTCPITPTLYDYKQTKDMHPVRNTVPVYGAFTKDATYGQIPPGAGNWWTNILSDWAADAGTLNQSVAHAIDFYGTVNNGTAKFYCTPKPYTRISGLEHTGLCSVGTLFFNHKHLGGALPWLRLNLHAPDTWNYFSKNIGTFAVGTVNIAALQLGPNTGWETYGTPSWSNITKFYFNTWASGTTSGQISFFFAYPSRFCSIASDPSSIQKFEVRYAEPFVDDNLGSDGECAAKAQSLLGEQKDPVATVENVLVTGDERYLPGDTVVLLGVVYRILEVQHSFVGAEWTVTLVVSEV